MKQNNKVISAIYKGELVQLERQSNGEYKLMRVLSTNPKAFLNEDLQLGKILEKNNFQNWL